MNIVNRKPLRVIMLSQYPLDEREQALGGIMQSTFQLIGGFAELDDPDLELHVVSINESCTSPFTETKGRIQFHFLPKSRSTFGIVVVDTLRQLRYIRRLVRRICPHVIHAQNNVGYILLSLYLGLPNVQTIHGIFRNEQRAIPRDQLSAGDRLRFRIKEALEVIYIRRIRNLIAITGQIESLLRTQGRRDIRIDRINNSTEPAFFARPERLAERGVESKLTILFVALITPRKGLHVLADAFKKLAAAHENAVLRIVGLPDHAPDYVAEQKNALRDLIEAGRVVFTGGVTREQLIAEYQGADIFVLPSFAESAPMAISQALCMGLPIVTTNVGGIPEMIQDKEVGLLVPPGDAAALADALEFLILRPEERRRLALSANKAGIERYHPKSNASAIGKVYRRISETESFGQRAAQE